MKGHGETGNFEEQTGNMIKVMSAYLAGASVKASHKKSSQVTTYRHSGIDPCWNFKYWNYSVVEEEKEQPPEARIKEQIKVMQAYLDGATVIARDKSGRFDSLIFGPGDIVPSWSWDRWDYSIKPRQYRIYLDDSGNVTGAADRNVNEKLTCNAVLVTEDIQ